MNPIQPIPEEDTLTVVDKNGNKIQLNPDQIEYLKTLGEIKVDDNQEIDYDILESMDPLNL